MSFTTGNTEYLKICDHCGNAQGRTRDDAGPTIQAQCSNCGGTITMNRIGSGPITVQGRL